MIATRQTSTLRLVPPGWGCEEACEHQVFPDSEQRGVFVTPSTPA